MRAGQREARDAVIIWRTLPRSGGVAVGARGGKTELRVRWTLRGGEVLLVARLTHRGLSLEHVVGVAAATEGEAVCAGEGELRGAVIERRTLPRLHAVARRAQSRERRGRVRRRCGFVVVRGVTTHARHRLALEHAIRVASGAVHGAMRTRECKLREVVIVFGGVPGRDVVARRTILRKSRALMVRRCRAPERARVAANARRGTSAILALSRHGSGVAPFARDANVCAAQRKAREFVGTCHACDVHKAARRVASVARGAELALVYVRVARRTARRDGREDQRLVAAHALGALMCAVEWKATLRVAEG